MKFSRTKQLIADDYLSVSTAQRVIPAQVQQSDSGPVQSRSFRVLQKITDTDSTNDVDTEQIRKLQLSDDDRILMNKFKEQGIDYITP